MKFVLGLLLAMAVPQWGWGMPVSSYDFDVFLDGNPIGSHRFEFEGNEQGYVVKSTAAYKVKILFVPVYRYDHHSRETWRDGCLQRIDARTDDNGEDYRVAGTVKGEGLLVEVNGDERQYSRECSRTFAYWQPELLDAGKLLNSQTGEFDKVELRRLGKSPLPWNSGQHAETLELDTPKGSINLWYDEGRWLGLLSRLENGRELLYRPAAKPQALNAQGQTP